MGLVACLKFVWSWHTKVNSEYGSTLTLQLKCGAWKAILTIEVDRAN